MSKPSPSERTLVGRAAAHASWSRTPDRAARTAPARAAATARFEQMVDPDGKLSPAERAVRAESARRAFYASMALKSARARRKAREAIDELTTVSAALADAHEPDDGSS